MFATINKNITTATPMDDGSIIKSKIKYHSKRKLEWINGADSDRKPTKNEEYFNQIVFTISQKNTKKSNELTSFAFFIFRVLWNGVFLFVCFVLRRIAIFHTLYSSHKLNRLRFLDDWLLHIVYTIIIIWRMKMRKQKT